ncbi:MAG: nuclear transport factor 2 family protein [Pseudomonadota bacterium]
MPDDLPFAVCQYVDAYTAGDVHGVEECIALADVRCGKTDVMANTKAEFRQLAEAALPHFASRNHEITSHITVAHPTIVEIAYEALLAADLPHGLKVGQTLRLTGRPLFEVEAGQIARPIDER